MIKMIKIHWNDVDLRVMSHMLLIFSCNHSHLFIVGQKNQCNIRAAHDGKVSCNTINYIVSFVSGQDEPNPEQRLATRAGTEYGAILPPRDDPLCFGRT